MGMPHIRITSVGVLWVCLTLESLVKRFYGYAEVIGKVSIIILSLSSKTLHIGIPIEH